MKPKQTRISPFKDNGQISVSEYISSDWDSRNDFKKQKPKTFGDEEEALSRRRRSYEAGTEEYASYVEKRIFNIRESWTPFLWQRIR